MYLEFFAKDANKSCFLNLDGTCHIVKKDLHVAVYAKTTGILDMSAQIAVLHFITDQLIAILLEWSFVVDAVQKIATQSENFQELEASFKLVKVLNQCAATVSVVVNPVFSNMVMIFGVTVTAEINFDKILKLEYFPLLKTI